MPRHRHRGHQHGGSNGSGRGGSYQHDRNAMTLRCSHCDKSLRAFHFPKTVIAKYEKKLGSGHDPSSIKTICKQCCSSPPSAPTPAAAPVERACCSRCRIEYPLTTAYFLKADKHLRAAGNRICFSCRNNELADHAVDQVYAGEDQEAFDPHEVNQEIAPYEGSDDELRIVPREQPIQRIEDQDETTQLHARRAANRHGNVVTKIHSVFMLARQRRLARRYMPLRERFSRHKIERATAETQRLEELHGHELVERQSRLVKHDALDPDDLCLPVDLAAMTDLSDLVEPSFARPDQERDLEDIEPVNRANQPDDASGDEDDVIPMWHLSDRQKVERQRMQRDLDLDRDAAPRDAFSIASLADVVDDDLVQRFVHNMSLSDQADTGQLERVSDYRMLCALKLVHEDSREPGFKRRRADAEA